MLPRFLAFNTRSLSQLRYRNNCCTQVIRKLSKNCRKTNKNARKARKMLNTRRVTEPLVIQKYEINEFLAQHGQSRLSLQRYHSANFLNNIIFPLFSRLLFQYQSFATKSLLLFISRNFPKRRIEKRKSRFFAKFEMISKLFVFFFYSFTGSCCPNDRTIHRPDRSILFLNSGASHPRIHRDSYVLGHRIRIWKLGRSEERDYHDSRFFGLDLWIPKCNYRHNQVVHASG